MIKTIIILFTSLLVNCILSCSESSRNNQKSILEHKVDSLAFQNNQLLKRLNPPRSSFNKTYFFAVIKSEEMIGYNTEFEEKQSSINEYITEIHTISNFTTEDEYRFLDKAIFDYSELIKNEYNILGRKCYKFSTYEEASKVRERLLNIIPL